MLHCYRLLANAPPVRQLGEWWLGLRRFSWAWRSGVEGGAGEACRESAAQKQPTAPGGLPGRMSALPVPLSAAAAARHDQGADAEHAALTRKPTALGAELVAG